MIDQKMIYTVGITDFDCFVLPFFFKLHYKKITVMNFTEKESRARVSIQIFTHGWMIQNGVWVKTERGKNGHIDYRQKICENQILAVLTHTIVIIRQNNSSAISSPM